MAQSVTFWNIFARKYSKKPIADINSYEFKLDLTQKYLKPEFRVLEVGCGTGSTAILHAPFVSEYHAIDYSPKMIEICEEKLRESIHNNLYFSVGTLEDVTDSYDSLLALNYLHLTKHYERNIKKMSELLKKDGLIFLSTPCFGSASPKRFLFNILSQLGVIPFVNFFTKKQLLTSLSKNNLSIIEHHQPGKNKRIHFIIAKKVS